MALADGNANLRVCGWRIGKSASVSKTPIASSDLRINWSAIDAVVPRKASKFSLCCPYRKPTQVDEMSILRRVKELSLRNSAN